MPYGSSQIVNSVQSSALRGVGRLRDQAKRKAVDHATDRYRRKGIIDDTVRLPYGTFIEGDASIGSYTTFSSPPRIRGKGRLVIGRYCAFGDDFRAVTSNHDLRFASTHFRPAKILGIEEPIALRGQTTVGNGVWIGDGVTLLPGATIGDGAVIGAGSIVAKDVPAFAIAVGSPCRVVRQRFSDEMIDALLRVAWWQWNDEQILASRTFFELDLTLADPEAVRQFAGQRFGDGTSD